MYNYIFMLLTASLLSEPMIDLGGPVLGGKCTMHTSMDATSLEQLLWWASSGRNSLVLRLQPLTILFSYVPLHSNGFLLYLTIS